MSKVKNKTIKHNLSNIVFPCETIIRQYRYTPKKTSSTTCFCVSTRKSHVSLCYSQIAEHTREDTHTHTLSHIQRALSSGMLAIYRAQSSPPPTSILCFHSFSQSIGLGWFARNARTRVESNKETHKYP